MNKKYTYKKLVEALNKVYYLKGDEESIGIDGIHMTEIASKTQMTFIDENRKDKAELLSNCSAGLIIGDEELLKYRKQEQNILVVQNPKVCFSLISNQFFITKTVPSISDKANINEVIEVLTNFVGESVPVINKDSGAIVGVISENDVLKSYNQISSEIRSIEK